MSHAATAHNHIHSLVKGSVIESTRESSSTVDCYVVHPTRQIDVTSFVRAAKKQGLVVSSVPSATNRHKAIVAYITMTDKSVLCVKGTNAESIHVEVRFSC